MVHRTEKKDSFRRGRSPRVAAVCKNCCYQPFLDHLGSAMVKNRIEVISIACRILPKMISGVGKSQAVMQPEDPEPGIYLETDNHQLAALLGSEAFLQATLDPWVQSLREKAGNITVVVCKADTGLSKDAIHQGGLEKCLKDLGAAKIRVSSAGDNLEDCLAETLKVKGFSAVITPVFFPGRIRNFPCCRIGQDSR